MDRKKHGVVKAYLNFFFDYIITIRQQNITNNGTQNTIFFKKVIKIRKSISIFTIQKQIFWYHTSKQYRYIPSPSPSNNNRKTETSFFSF